MFVRFPTFGSMANEKAAGAIMNVVEIVLSRERKSHGVLRARNGLNYIRLPGVLVAFGAGPIWYAIRKRMFAFAFF